MIQIPFTQKDKVIAWCTEHISLPEENRHVVTSGPGWKVYWAGLATYAVKFDDEKYELLLRLAL